ncbi:MAG: neutral zinc metallopeptidase [Acidobacteriaceae bacterium]
MSRFFTSNSTRSYYTRSTSCVGLPVVLAATLRIGEASRADIKGGLQAAAAVGDDRLQKMSRGYVTPDSFTHGSSEQRMSWFNRGFTTGQVSACNTFSGGS